MSTFKEFKLAHRIFLYISLLIFLLNTIFIFLDFFGNDLFKSISLAIWIGTICADIISSILLFVFGRKELKLKK